MKLCVIFSSPYHFLLPPFLWEILSPSVDLKSEFPSFFFSPGSRIQGANGDEWVEGGRCSKKKKKKKGPDIEYVQQRRLYEQFWL